MKYVHCPRCQARFHTGVIYESPDVCTRCGTPLPERGRRVGGQLRAILGRRLGRSTPDWEAITGSQYTDRRVARRSSGPPGSTVRRGA